jgi:K+-sensing histidine kinase KdpD
MLRTVLSYIPVIFCLYGIGVLTLLKDTSNRIHVYFVLFAFSLASWLLALFVADFSLQTQIGLWSLRTASVFGTSTAPFFLMFCMVFPIAAKHSGQKVATVLSYPSLFFIALSFTPWIVPAVEIRDNSAQLVGVGLLYTLQSLYIIIVYLFGIGLLGTKLRYATITARQKSQISLVISGITVAIFINILTNFVFILMNLGSNYTNLISSISFLVFVSTTAYAIIHHRLFDIRLAITRAVGFLLTILTIAVLYSFLVLAMISPFIAAGWVTIIQHPVQLLLLLPPTIFVGLTFHIIERYIGRVTHRIFFHDVYDLRTKLDELSDSLLAATSIDDIMSQSLWIITESIRPNSAYFLVFNESGEVYHSLAFNRTPPQNASEILAAAHKFSVNPVVRDTLIDQPVPATFIKQNIDVVLKLGPSDKPGGLIIFGPKQNGRIYTKTDMDLLRISAKNLGVALDNAKKYEQISHFADTLHQEVERATAKLRRANERLKSLDVLKDDFMSMASHQLRSPATSVHESLHMLNHPALNKKDRDDLIALAEASSERLVTVVKTMLNMARLQAGRFTIDRGEENVTKLADKVIDQSQAVADQRGIRLKFTKPSAKIIAFVDAAKVTEAMANYVENAIKYSPEKSTVSINLSLQSNRIIFEVTDAGMGVPLEERGRLFGKFYRATNAREEEPDGNGIGLYVVRSIAEGHGGEAYYKPLKQGSLFGFWIPMEHMPALRKA